METRLVMTPKKDISNVKFGRLLAIEPTNERINTAIVWLCKCDCGNHHKVSIKNLMSGHSKSCGCLEKENRAVISKMGANRKPKGQSSFNAVYGSYKQSAERRGLEFSLNEKLFREITSSNCIYCGTPPSNIRNDGGRYNGNYVYSGIDRVDSSKGYVEENVVPCCSVCNYAKRQMSEKEFLSWVVRVYEYRNGI